VESKLFDTLNQKSLLLAINYVFNIITHLRRGREAQSENECIPATIEVERKVLCLELPEENARDDLGISFVLEDKSIPEENLCGDHLEMTCRHYYVVLESQEYHG